MQDSTTKANTSCFPYGTAHSSSILCFMVSLQPSLWQDNSATFKCLLAGCKIPMMGTMMGYTHAHSIFIIIYWQFSRLCARLCSRGQTLGLTPLCTSSWRRRDAFIPFSCVFPATLSLGNHHLPFHLGKFTRFEADYLLPHLQASKQKAICSFSAIRCRVVESSCKERAWARSALPLLAALCPVLCKS